MLIILKEAIKKTPIKVDTLFRMIDYQFYNLERRSQISNMEELELYAENTRSLLIYLNLNLLNIKDENAYIVGSHVGRGIGLVDVLKKFTTLIKLNINMLPRSLVEKYNATGVELWDRHGNSKEALFDIFLEIAAYAKKHLEVSREMSSKLQKGNAHVAFLQVEEALNWLSKLEQCNFNLFDESLKRISSFTIPRKMMALGKQGKY